MMHSDSSLPGNLSLTKKFYIKMSGVLLEHFNMNKYYNIYVKMRE